MKAPSAEPIARKTSVQSTKFTRVRKTPPISLQPAKSHVLFQLPSFHPPINFPLLPKLPPTTHRMIATQPHSPRTPAPSSHPSHSSHSHSANQPFHLLQVAIPVGSERAKGRCSFLLLEGASVPNSCRSRPPHPRAHSIPIFDLDG
jgi:hypothetical protein